MSHVVALPYTADWHALAWAKKNCPSYITNSSEPNFLLKPGAEWKIIYYFAQEEDAAMFALRWVGS